MTDTPTADPTPNPAESVESSAGPARIEPLPPSHGGWAAVTLLFFWPLSFSAFSHAFTVYPLWASGEFAAARYASDRVRRLGQLALWLAGALVLLTVVLSIVLTAVVEGGGGYDESPHHGVEQGQNVDDH